MHKVCSILTEECYAEKEIIFTSGNPAVSAFFLNEGALVYTSIYSRGESLVPPPKPKECIAEAALWVEWRHQGELTGRWASELFTIGPQRFTEVFKSHPRPWSFAAKYAGHFLKYIQNIEPEKYIDFVRDPEFQQEAVNSLDVKKNKSLLDQVRLALAPD